MLYEWDVDNDLWVRILVKVGMCEVVFSFFCNSVIVEGVFELISVAEIYHYVGDWDVSMVVWIVEVVGLFNVERWKLGLGTPS